jgi:putative transposase
MPRSARITPGGIVYHVLNRGNARQTVFSRDEDYTAFIRAVSQACEQYPLRVLAYCVLPTHFHLVLWPHRDGDLSRWMQWAQNAHVRRHHQLNHSSGHLWQGRYKAFPIAPDDHLLAVLRYVEGNPLRAGLVREAQDWPWSSLRWLPGAVGAPLALDPGPVPRPADWLALVNQPQTEAELARLRASVNRGSPFGEPAWQQETAVRLSLQHTLRPRGRPRKLPR